MPITTFSANHGGNAKNTPTFQLIFNALPGLKLLLSPALTIEAATDAYILEMGMTRSSMIGRNVFDVFPDNPSVQDISSSSKLKHSLQQVLSTKETHKMDVFQYDIPDPENTGAFLQRYWLTTNTPVLDGQDEVIFIIHETINVTEDVQASHLLEQSKEREKVALAEAEQQRLRLERLFKQAPAACAMLEGPDLVFKVINDAYKQLFPGRELLNLPLFKALPELKDQPVFNIVQHVITTGETFEGKEVLVPLARYEGQPLEDIYWNFIYQALYDAQGNISGMLIFALDVTEFVEARIEVEKSAAALQSLNRELEARVERRTKDMKHAQAVAEQQSKRLENLFMRAPASICILRGPELIYELVNPGYAKLFPGRELLGKPILEALPEIRENRVYETFRKVYETGEIHEEPEILIPIARPGDGMLEDRYFRYIQQASYNEIGEVVGVVVFAIEITEQVKARKTAEASEQEAIAIAQELESANRRLTHTNADLDNFIYTASHDLKAPISNIEMLMGELMVELPQESLVQGEVKAIIGMMEGAVKRFKKTIFSLTEISKLQQQNYQLEEKVNIRSVVKGVMLDLEKSITNSGARIETSIDENSGVAFSEKNLRSIVYNLLSNALKYKHPERDPLVNINCYEDESHVVLQVKDNGLGLSEEQQGKLFTMFRRFHDHVEGTGIGLYMVKRMIDNAGGSITVESQVGKGTTFQVFLRKR